MIPPVHLREIPDEITKDGRRIVMDRRVKVLSYNEGVSGAELNFLPSFDRKTKQLRSFHHT